MKNLKTFGYILFGLLLALISDFALYYIYKRPTLVPVAVGVTVFLSIIVAFILFRGVKK